jgi:hypothetical protein
MVEPIQGDEEILLDSRSMINKIKHGTPQLAIGDTKTRLEESKLHEDIPRR